ncbi:hypothetical protein K469DRAFT_542400, partial [Zopfia rhizophila CBS 207.26]
QNIAQLEQIIGYPFTNKLICAEAIQMAGLEHAVVMSGTFHCVAKNQTLAVLGDAVQANPYRLVAWTVLRNHALDNIGLSQRGYELGIQNCIIIGESVVFASKKMIATTFEAIIGAVQEDGG